MKVIYMLIAVLLVFAVFGTATESSANEIDEPAINSWISDFVDKIEHWLKTHGKGLGKKCFEKRKKGGVASAERGDSPLKVFGYPHFNERIRSAEIKGEVPLSFIGGYRQAIKIGSRDYVFAGYPEEILAFCACFEKYKVLGSSLSESGHWVHNTGIIKIQLQNLQKYNQRSVFDILFKYTLDRIMKYLQPVKMIKGLDCQILGGCDAASSEEKFKEALKKIEKWIPGSENVIKKILEMFKNKKMTLEEKVKALLDFIMDEEKRKGAIRKKWIGWDNVSYKNKKIMVTLTMYNKPERNVRATFRMPSASVTMKDVGEAIKVALEKK